MISVLKNKDGYVRSYIEWTIVDEQGKTKNKGNFIYINNVWVHKQHRKKWSWGDIRELIPKIKNHPYAKYALYVYWRNDKKNKQNRIIPVDIICKGDTK